MPAGRGSRSDRYSPLRRASDRLRSFRRRPVPHRWIDNRCPQGAPQDMPHRLVYSRPAAVRARGPRSHRTLPHAGGANGAGGQGKERAARARPVAGWSPGALSEKEGRLLASTATAAATTTAPRGTRRTSATTAAAVTTEAAPAPTASAAPTASGRAPFPRHVDGDGPTVQACAVQRLDGALRFLGRAILHETKTTGLARSAIDDDARRDDLAEFGEGLLQLLIHRRVR